MLRYICLALLTALLLTFVSCSALAEADGLDIEGIDAVEPDVELSDSLELADLVIADQGLLGELTTEDSAASGAVQDNASDRYALNATSITIGVNEKYTKLMVVSDAAANALPKITWRSGNKKIAKVNSHTGKVTGVKKGKTTIYAKIEGNKKEIKCRVNVLKAPRKSKFSISPNNGSLRVGQTGQYKIEFDHGYGGSFTFSSSDEDVATIDEDGVVTAVAPGTCKITVTTYNDVSRTVSLQVLENGSSESDKIDKLLEYARSKLDKPYKHSCFGPDKFDCVGFTCWCYKQLGVKLKDTPTKQADDTRFVEVSYDELEPGDLVYFHTDESSKPSHAALYLGEGEIIHASATAGKVIISELCSSRSDYYKRNFYCGRRVFP